MGEHSQFSCNQVNGADGAGNGDFRRLLGGERNPEAARQIVAGPTRKHAQGDVAAGEDPGGKTEGPVPSGHRESCSMATVEYRHSFGERHLDLRCRNHSLHDDPCLTLKGPAGPANEASGAGVSVRHESQRQGARVAALGPAMFDGADGEKRCANCDEEAQWTTSSPWTGRPRHQGRK
jgi:hypothetical protein